MTRSPTGRQYRFRDDLAWREVGGVYHMLTADNRYHCVEDEVGSLVLKRVETGASLEEMVREVADRYDAPETEIRRDLQAFLADLVRKRILTRHRPQSG